MKRTVLLLVAATLVLGGCGYNIPPDMVALRVGAGPFEPKKIKECIPANDRKLFWETNDSYYPFPTSEREWDATGKKGSDSGRFTSVTKDNVVMRIPVTVRFTIKTDCTTLKKFYTQYVRRYGAEFKTNGEYNEQWETLLRKLVADPADQTLDRIVQKYNWRSVWNDPKTKVQIERELDQRLTSKDSLMVQTAKASYFEGISVLVGTPTPDRQELKDAVALEQQAVADAKSKEAEADARAAQARAELAVTQAQAAKRREAIEGYGGIDAYLKALAIKRGQNPYQPTYVVPQQIR
jgi:hypothetical protein